MPRLFVAIDLPQRQKEALAHLEKWLSGARWVPPEQIHLTLRFLGEVDERQTAVVKKVLQTVSFPPFTLSLRGLGHFPPGKHPRVLWVGLEATISLLELYKDVELALGQADIPPDLRSFSPHITLARLRDTPAAAVETMEASYRDFGSDPFPVEEFILFSSELTRSGAIHRKEGVYRCRPQSEG